MTYGQKRLTKGLTFKVVVCLHVVVVTLFLFLGFSSKKPKMVKILPVGLVGRAPGTAAVKAVASAPAKKTEAVKPTTVVKKKIPPKVVKKKIKKKKTPPKVVKKKIKKKKTPPKVVKKKIKKKKTPPKVVKKRVPKISRAERIAQIRATHRVREAVKPRVTPSASPRFDAADIREHLKSSSSPGRGGGVPGSYTQSVGQKFESEWQNFKAWVGTDESEKVLVNVTWNKYGTITNYKMVRKSGNAQLNAKVARFLLYMKGRVKLPAFPSSMTQLSITKPFEISR